MPESQCERRQTDFQPHSLQKHSFQPSSSSHSTKPALQCHLQLKEALNPGKTLIVAATCVHLPAWIRERGRTESPLLGKECSDTAQDSPFAVPQLTVYCTMDLKVKSAIWEYRWGFWKGSKRKWANEGSWTADLHWVGTVSSGSSPVSRVLELLKS